MAEAHTDKVGSPARRMAAASGARRCRQKFLRVFPEGFYDETYLAWERIYKWEAHQRWKEELSDPQLNALLAAGAFGEIATRAVRIESRTNLIFSFEKMALRDGIKPAAGARTFAKGLNVFLKSEGERDAFEAWIEALAALPRKQTRVLTWPVATVFPFLAQPRRHLFIKPNVMRAAATAYGFAFDYASRPSWRVYSNALAFARQVKRDLADLKPRDMIDIQSFLWVQGSEEYAE